VSSQLADGIPADNYRESSRHRPPRRFLLYPRRCQFQTLKADVQPTGYYGLGLASANLQLLRFSPSSPRGDKKKWTVENSVSSPYVVKLILF
jgi:hypothetical protein